MGIYGPWADTRKDIRHRPIACPATAAAAAHIPALTPPEPEPSSLAKARAFSPTGCCAWLTWRRCTTAQAMPSACSGATRCRRLGRRRGAASPSSSRRGSSCTWPRTLMTKREIGSSASTRCAAAPPPPSPPPPPLTPPPTPRSFRRGLPGEQQQPRRQQGCNQLHASPPAPPPPSGRHLLLVLLVLPPRGVPRRQTLRRAQSASSSGSGRACGCGHAPTPRGGRCAACSPRPSSRRAGWRTPRVGPPPPKEPIDPPSRALPLGRCERPCSCV